MQQLNHLEVHQGVLLCASSGVRTLLDGSTTEGSASLLRGLIDPETLASAERDGIHCRQRECVDASGRSHRLRVTVQTAPRSAIDTVRFVALIEPEDGPASESLDQRRKTETDNEHLRSIEAQLLQADKMASIGQLAAGVAHEINNPIGYIHSNLATLNEYVRNMLQLISTYESLLRQSIPDSDARHAEIALLKEQVDYDFLVRDLPNLLSESREGTERVRKIVQDLRDFSRAGSTEEWTLADLQQGLDSTLNIVWNDLKYKCEVLRQYDEIPRVECLPSQLNQVFLNILVNAGHAIESRGSITIATCCEGENVVVAISDSGCGISPDHLDRIFDPFFTTKPVGQGTGLGLSLSYGIVRKHGGRIEVQSTPGVGTTFRIVLPQRQPAPAVDADPANAPGAG
ncbi:MAG: sensor histidine kinase [Xanthomonadaceae bacterium]|nr:sensor histidine kinase [Xanthomonadaceae bacterium]